MGGSGCGGGFDVLRPTFHVPRPTYLAHLGNCTNSVGILYLLSFGAMCYNKAAFAIDDAAYEAMKAILGVILSDPSRLETASYNGMLEVPFALTVQRVAYGQTAAFDDVSINHRGLHALVTHQFLNGAGRMG